MIFSLGIGFILGAAVLLFAIQNTEIVALTFMGWHFAGSLALLVLLSLAAGIVISVLVSIPSTISASFKISRLKKQNEKLIEEAETREHAHAATQPPEQPPEVVDLRK